MIVIVMVVVEGDSIGILMVVVKGDSDSDGGGG